MMICGGAKVAQYCPKRILKAAWPIDPQGSSFTTLFESVPTLELGGSGDKKEIIISWGPVFQRINTMNRRLRNSLYCHEISSVDFFIFY